MTIVNGNVYTIANYEYPNANIANWEGGEKSIGTYEKKLYFDQFWLLKESERHEGFYYIINTARRRLIGMLSPHNESIRAYADNGKKDERHLWKFKKHDGKDMYQIYNKKFDSHKLAKWGGKDGDFGASTAADYDGQFWTLTPKYKVEKRNIIWRIIKQVDNREGTEEVVIEETVTNGLTLTKSKSLSTKLGTQTSLQTAASYPGLFEGEVAQTVSAEITSAMSTSEERSWSRSVKWTFKAPAGKNYRVRQRLVTFNSQLPQDNLCLNMYTEINESTESFTY
jgi:hypothetical protein